MRNIKLELVQESAVLPRRAHLGSYVHIGNGASGPFLHSGGRAAKTRSPRCRGPQQQSATSQCFPALATVNSNSNKSSHSAAASCASTCLMATVRRGTTSQSASGRDHLSVVPHAEAGAGAGTSQLVAARAVDVRAGAAADADAEPPLSPRLVGVSSMAASQHDDPAGAGAAGSSDSDPQLQGGGRSGVQTVQRVAGDMKLRPITEASASSAQALADLQRSTNVAGVAGGDAPSRYMAERKSTIIALGLSIHSTPVEMRERLAVQADEWEAACAELCAYPHIEEAVILSTCNRMEVYVVALSSSRGTMEVEQWMAKRSGLDIDALREHLFVYCDRDATKHVLQVAAGLDSMVMGEGQILSQVKAVYEMGQSCGAVGRHLNGLFRAAVVSGKRVRTETGIAVGAVSVSSAAVELAVLKLPEAAKHFDGVRVCVVGAGKMSRLVVKHLVAKGCTSISIVNRTAPRAEELAADFAHAAEISISVMDNLIDECARSDVIFVASSSTELILTKDHVTGMTPCSDHVGGLRRFFDISVPRNCAADINAVSDAAMLFNVDDLKEVVEGNKSRRAEAAREAEQIILADQTSFEIWQNSLEAVPTIKALRAKAEAVRVQALDKALKAFGPDINKKQRKSVEELSKQIINRLLHGPMQSMRSDGTDAEQVNETLVNMHAIQRMFSLNGNEPSRRGTRT